MSAIGPGDFVECIAATFPQPDMFRPSGFQVGAIYIVLTCGADAFGPWINCVGMLTPGDCYYTHAAAGWYACYFRPIYRPKQSIIEALKQPAPEEPVSA